MTTTEPFAETLNGSRTTPLYTVSEAAHLARVSPTTVRNWLYGTEKSEALFPPSRTPMVSFLQLIEIVVAARFRKSERVSLARLRKAHINACEDLNLQFPFAYEQLELVGGHIVRILHTESTATSYQSMDEPSQWTLPGLVAGVKRQIRYEHELAAQWYPAGTDVPIVIDPRITSGLPTISGRGVTVQIIRKRFLAGQDIDFIARDFDINKDVVEDAVRYGELIAA